MKFPWLGEKKSYWLWLKSAGHLLKTYCRLKVEGRENIPDEGSVLIVSNHRSYWDPPLLAIAVWKRRVFFMAKEELFETPILSSLIRHWGNAFPVKRGTFDKTALETAIELLKAGKAVCIFPEGTRSKTGKLLKPKWGAGFVAIKSKSLIVPCYISGSFGAFPKVSVKFGKPFKLELEDTKENYVKGAQVLMERIKETAGLR